MFERQNYFNMMIEKLSQTLFETGKCCFDKNEFQKRFFLQSSHTPDNIESIDLVDYGCARTKLQRNIKKYGVKIKDKNVLLSDIMYAMENDEITAIIAKELPDLTIQEIDGALRVMTIMMLGFECRELKPVSK